MCNTLSANEGWRGGSTFVVPPLSREKVRRIYLAEGRQVDIASVEEVSKNRVWRIKHRVTYKYYTSDLPPPPPRKSITIRVRHAGGFSERSQMRARKANA